MYQVSPLKSFNCMKGRSDVNDDEKVTQRSAMSEANIFVRDLISFLNKKGLRITIIKNLESFDGN